MQVFLVPIGAVDYEPYYEPVAGDDAPSGDDTGFVARQRRRLNEMLREAEEERHRRHEPDEPQTRMTRGRRRLMRWIVERAAEQRLLWHLRTAPAATLHVPSDLTSDAALGILKDGLKRDSDRHFRWFLLHLVLLILSGVLFFIPGPNLVGYFFTFTTVGHLLAWRGASRGGTAVTWTVRASTDLTDLRAVLRMDTATREQHLHDLGQRLGLQHLATFVARLAIPPA